MKNPTQQESPDIQHLDKMILQHLNLFLIETRNIEVHIENILSSAHQNCQSLGQNMNIDDSKKFPINCQVERSVEIKEGKKKEHDHQSDDFIVDTIEQCFEVDKENIVHKNERCKKISEFARKLKLDF